MGVKEKNLQAKINLAIAKHGHRLFRCNSGKFWQGQIHRKKFTEGDSYITIRHPRLIHGHATGTPDLCGWTMIEITPELVGTKLPVFTAIETKTPNDQLSKKQRAVIKLLKKFNAIVGVARCAEDFFSILSVWLVSTKSDRERNQAKRGEISLRTVSKRKR